ncbi:hypothetical protein [Borreliella tanukii]|uniref:hypothetical protein n=1 Tax=Borreliella tanukii TaxID=56146 RepID=UPI002647E6DC|nr:hypothetical protein [Borreliella tanukii]WKC79930.1 hypothetical protein QIA28_03285 [Borreliella tanukii]
MNKTKNLSFKYFIILSCILLFGANNTISYSSIEIPFEDLSEEFKDTGNKNDQINTPKHLNKNIVSYKDPKKGKDLKLPENIRDKKLFKKRMDENDLKSVIENYENKIKNIEKLLKNKNQKVSANEKEKIESIERKAKKYEILTNKLKNEILEIKKLLNEKLGPKEDENYEKINTENIEEEEDDDDDDFEENYEYNDEIEEINEDNRPSNERIIKNLKETLHENEKYFAINEKKFDELEDRINDNENTILDLQRELRNFKKKDDSNKNLEEIEENLSSIGKIINDLRKKISTNEAINKENQKKIRTDKHKLKELEDKIKENEETILKLQKELNNFKKKEISQKLFNEETFVPPVITNKNDDLEENNELENKYLKPTRPTEKNENQDLEENTKSTPKTTMIKTADFQIYPDIYLNNYKFKEKGDQFAFKKENTYYIEIDPTNNLNEALKNHEIISKYKFEKYFINPTLKNKEEFFRNLIEVKNIHELGIMYKSLKPEFKQIKIIK